MNRPGALRPAVVALTVALVCGSAAGVAPAAPNLRVRGSQLVDGRGRGHVVVLRGVNRSGLEYACIQGWGFFDSPHPNQIDDPGMIAAMTSWDINAVRVPLNADCWLGLQTAPGRGGQPYRQIVYSYVQALNRAGLYVILDLHWTAPGGVKATGQLPMADRDNAPRFWRSVAGTFKRDHAVIFDLYNEPFGIDWSCWRDGCEVHPGGNVPDYQAAGMQELVDAVRASGAGQPLLLGGLQWSLDLSGWATHAPRDPLHQLVASEHNYGGLSPCDTTCREAILATHKRVPVIFGELGETDCADDYVDPMMGFADSHGIGYLAWAWDAVSPGGWSCSGPSLIENYSGVPTAFGVGFRDHLRSLKRRSEPHRPLLR